MRITLIPVLVLTLFVTTPALAHDKVFIRTYVNASNSRCAIELEIFEDDQNNFTNEDNLKYDDEEILNFTDLVAAGINDDGAAHNSGDRLLFASENFAESFEVTPDIQFENSICGNINNSVSLIYSINDDSVIDEIVFAEVEGFTNNTALRKSSLDSSISVTDLIEQTITVETNSGTEVTVDLSNSENPLVISSCRADLTANQPHKRSSELTLTLLVVTSLFWYRIKNLRGRHG